MGKVAFLFAGQGSQYTCMGKSLYDISPAARQVLDDAEALRPGTLDICFAGTKEELARTENTQPCLFAVDAACAAALVEEGVAPEGLAGFSLGEIAALPSSGMLSFAQAFLLVVERAKLMRTCAVNSESGMVAVLKLADEEVEALCAGHGAYPVNYNCPGQVACALKTKDIPAFAAAIKAAGGRALPLNVSGGFHSPFMNEAASGLRAYAETLSFQKPVLPLYADAVCRPYTAEVAAQWLGDQVENPVCWTALIRAMQADGFTDFIEVGAGHTLSGLVERIGGAQSVCHVEDAETLNETVRRMKGDALC
jgi:[acyl-carrier-protein] S-malonyltransferase